MKYCIIQIQYDRKELWSERGVWVCMHYDLNGNITVGQCHDTPFCNGRQLCKILSRSNMAVKELRPSHGFWLCVYCEIGLGDMTLGQCHALAVGNGKQFC